MSQRDVGRGEHFRSSSWLERGIAKVRSRRSKPAPAVLKRLHEFVLERLPGDHLVARLPGGERVRLSARYRQLAWNPEEYAAFRAATLPGAVVLDVGANIGAYTILFAGWAGREGRVFAFEPGPASRRGLATHLALNGTRDRVEIIPAAMSDRVGRARFDSDGASGMNALDPAGGIEVETTTIDAFCASHRIVPDVIKVDVEGAELEVLRGARQVIAAGTTALFVEVHPTVWKSRGVDAQPFRDELARQGLVAETLAPDLDPWKTEGICLRLRHG